ncbi:MULTISPECIES: peptidase inhibitor family I36 protein [unclassified Streptomyces]|uniref:peptidase inhibitor family I36 protein n=1 Tax=unclassified Streptomyces TaxID=2593676 RepID=UPI00081EE847|nr:MULTISPECIES: peptidase inhibitor family I36 protein [unclassified Streptomyces]MYR30080.1 peptidase inhibitor [Streptomyces sp. SID4945]SCD60553.1 Peptidase inhibitor family I36 [Streptomyces sp. TverLS-915]SCF48620.1 Peptidase inhibitor family I36 [Streptomyces sp. LcepLS]
MRRTPSFAVSVVALSVAALGAVPAAGAAPRQSPAAYSCSPGYFCVYDGWNGTGTRCQWSQSKLANTADNCSFIQRGANVRSVFNRTGHRVQYYTQTNYKNRVGSTPKNGKGNLQGNYQIRSFKPQ